MSLRNKDLYSNYLEEKYNMKLYKEERQGRNGRKKSFFQTKREKIFRKKTLYSRLPILQWVSKITIASLLSDLIAGFSVGLTLVPQSLAYATVAGLPPQYGLYSSIVGGFVYAVFGGTKSLAIGPVALLAITVYPMATKYGPEVAVFLAFVSGLIELALGLFNLGFFLDFISLAVIDGFTSAAALTISSTQLKSLFGLSYKSEGFLDTLIQFFKHIKQIRLADTIMGMTCLVLLFSMRALGRVKVSGDSTMGKVMSKSIWFLSTARNAICVFVCAGIAVSIYDPSSEDTFKLIGNITAGLPPFAAPPFQIRNISSGEVVLQTPELFTETGFSMIILPLVAILEAVAIAKAFSGGMKKVDASQEIIAIGASNVIGAFFSSFPVTGSFSRTAVNEASGVQTPISGVITSVIVVLAAQFLTPYFFYIPKASLAAVIVGAVILMVEYHVIIPMWRTKKSDLIPFATTFISGLLFGLELGIIVGTLVHIFMMSFANARPPIETEAIRKQEGTTVVIQPRESLMFPAADYFSNLVKKAISKEENVTCIIFDLAYVNRLDFATAKTFKDLSDNYGSSGVEVIAVNVMPKTLTVLEGIQPKKINITIS
ncbi:sodium-independent sulfate anion transporter-like isoform X2 [Artemia franciscana]|uniref:sodium-independent sulfate anion transporter-like isoform X2 n=1 Tax=Artemia franciscana TaxID=6661 RepID=UPI0032DB0A06